MSVPEGTFALTDGAAGRDITAVSCKIVLGLTAAVVGGTDSAVVSEVLPVSPATDVNPAVDSEVVPASLGGAMRRLTHYGAGPWTRLQKLRWL